MGSRDSWRVAGSSRTNRRESSTGSTPWPRENPEGDWFPWYPTLYEGDTMHLTLAQDGAYRRLIDWYMLKRRPLPDNDHARAAIGRIGIDEWLAMAMPVRAFFKPKNGLLYHKRCDIELDKQDKGIKKHSEISKKGAVARWGKNNGLDADGMPTAMLPA